MQQNVLIFYFVHQSIEKNKSIFVVLRFDRDDVAFEYLFIFLVFEIRRVEKNVKLIDEQNVEKNRLKCTRLLKLIQLQFFDQFQNYAIHFHVLHFHFLFSIFDHVVSNDVRRQTFLHLFQKNRMQMY